MVLAPPRAILNDRAHVSEISPWPAEMWILTSAGTGTVVSLWGVQQASSLLCGIGFSHGCKLLS